jgi:hypothetical protein
LAYATIVISVPYLSILAFPIGKTKSIDISYSVSSKLSPYIISFSKNTTGLGSLIAAFIKPLASLELYGAKVIRPGTDPYQEAKH